MILHVFQTLMQSKSIHPHVNSSDSYSEFLNNLPTTHIIILNCQNYIRDYQPVNTYLTKDT